MVCKFEVEFGFKFEFTVLGFRFGSVVLELTLGLGLKFEFEVKFESRFEFTVLGFGFGSVVFFWAWV